LYRRIFKIETIFGKQWPLVNRIQFAEKSSSKETPFI